MPSVHYCVKGWEVWSGKNLRHVNCFPIWTWPRLPWASDTWLRILCRNLRMRTQLICNCQSTREDLEFSAGRALCVFMGSQEPSSPFFRWEYSRSIDSFVVITIQTCVSAWINYSNFNEKVSKNCQLWTSEGQMWMFCGGVGGGENTWKFKDSGLSSRRGIPENRVPPRGGAGSSRPAAHTGSLLLPVWDAQCLRGQLPGDWALFRVGTDA